MKNLEEILSKITAALDETKTNDYPFDKIIKEFDKISNEFDNIFTKEPNEKTKNAMEESRNIMKNKDITNIFDPDKDYYVSGGYVYILVDGDDVGEFEDGNDTYYKFQVDDNFIEFELPENFSYMVFKNKKYIIVDVAYSIDISEYVAIPVAKLP